MPRPLFNVVLARCYTVRMALEGTYQLSANTKLGALEGMAVVTRKGNDVHVSLDAPIVGKVQAQGAAVGDNAFKVSGKTSVLFKRYDYTVEGTVEGDRLTAVCKAGSGQIKLTGTRVS